MKNHRLISETDLIKRSDLSEYEFALLKEARLIVPDIKTENLYRERLIHWCNKLSNLLDWDWTVAEIKLWAKERWYQPNPKQWPPNYSYWKNRYRELHKMAQNDTK